MSPYFRALRSKVGTDLLLVTAATPGVEYTVVVYRCEVRGRATTALDPETKSIKYFDRDAMPALALPYPLAVLFSSG